MNTLNVRRYNMFVRVKEFGAAHADLFPAGSPGAQRFADLGDVLNRIDTNVAAEASGHTDVQQGGASKAAARTALRSALEVVIRAAQGVAVTNPGVAETFRLPQSQSDHALVTKARDVVSHATPLHDAFVACGMPGTFAADLQAAADTFEHASKTRAAAKETHVGARLGIAATIESAFAVLRQLDPIVEKRVGDDPTLLGTWQCARRIEKPPVRSAKPASAPASSAVAPSPPVAKPEPAAPPPAGKAA